ncbi:MAG: hypothetical protein ACYDBV_09205 [Nitrospiria bacterium]
MSERARQRTGIGILLIWILLFGMDVSEDMGFFNEPFEIADQIIEQVFLFAGDQMVESSRSLQTKRINNDFLVTGSADSFLDIKPMPLIFHRLGPKYFPDQLKRFQFLSTYRI